MIKFHVCENRYQMTNLHPPLLLFFFSLINHFISLNLLPKVVHDLSTYYFVFLLVLNMKGSILADCSILNTNLRKQWYCIQNINNTCSAIKAHSPPFLDYFFFTQRCVNEIPEDAVDRNCWLHFSSAQCPWPLKCPHFHQWSQKLKMIACSPNVQFSPASCSNDFCVHEIVIQDINPF